VGLRGVNIQTREPDSRVQEKPKHGGVYIGRHNGAGTDKSPTPPHPFLASSQDISIPKDTHVHERIIPEESGEEMLGPVGPLAKVILRSCREKRYLES